MSENRQSARVLIVVLHYGNREDTRECLRSLASVPAPQFVVAVVENDPLNPLGEVFKEEFPAAVFITSPGNLGFAAANNLGLRYAMANRFEFSMLLNNDTTVEPDFLELLCAALDDDAQVAVAGPLMPYYHYRDKIWACGGRIWRWSGWIGPHIQIPAMGNRKVASVDYLPGACVLLRTSVLMEVGLLPEKYFLAFEEAEFCIAARRRGHRIVVCPGAVVYHKVGMSGDRAPKYIYNNYRNRLLFMKCLYGWLGGGLFGWLIGVVCWIRYPRERAMVTAAVRDHLKYARIERKHLTDFEKAFNQS